MRCLLFFIQFTTGERVLILDAEGFTIENIGDEKEKTEFHIFVDKNKEIIAAIQSLLIHSVTYVPDNKVM